MPLGFGNVSSSLDLSTPGRRSGVFGLAHSSNRFAFSTIQSPLAVIRGGDGPTALVCAGNHGDEYEGQIIVRRLYEELAPGDLAGRLILAPALNMPAVLDANRVSPLDGGNLNRSFPGVVSAGPTREIAGYVATQLMPMADVAIDIHSGGKATDYLDSSYFCISHDPARNRETGELVALMGLADTLVVPVADDMGDFDSAAHASGCAMLSCELGGEGRVSRRALESGWHGVLRVLVHRGIVHETAAVRLGMKPAGTTRFLDLGVGASFVTARSHGLVELLVGTGETVRAGQEVALVRDLYRLDAPSLVFGAAVDGVVAIRRTGALVAPGDHLLAICPILTDAELRACIADN